MNIDFKDVLIIAGIMLASCEIIEPEPAEEVEIQTEAPNLYDQEQKIYPLYDMDSQILISVDMIEETEQFYCNNETALFVDGLKWYQLDDWPQNTEYTHMGLLEMKSNRLLNDTLSSDPAYSLHITKDSILFYKSQTDPDVLCMGE